MARKASVRYWASRGTWTDAEGKTQRGAYCTTMDGRQYVLAAGPQDEPDGPTYRAALRAWLDVRDLALADRTRDATPVRVVIELHLRHVRANRAPGTYKLRQQHLAAFCASGLADQPIRDLTIFQVQRWVDEQKESRVVTGEDGVRRRRGWGSATVRTFLAGICSAFNWALRTRLITSNPLHGISLPPQRSRARLCLITPDLHLRMVNTAHAEMKPVLNALENSGCRPGELIAATAAAWNEQLGAIVYHAETRRLEGEARHKTSDQGKERRIFFSGAAQVAVRELVARYPSGPLFRFRGRSISPRTLADRFRSLSNRLKVPHLTAYSYRHTYATRWLEAGGSIDDLAALLGNTPDVIRLHYAHLLDNPGRLRQLAERFACRAAEQEGQQGKPPGTLPFKVAE